jgi:FkbM family methyltransferase
MGSEEVPFVRDMYANNNEGEKCIIAFEAQNRNLDMLQAKYLRYLKAIEFKPDTIFDIGSSIKHWSNMAKVTFPEAEVYLFDAYDVFQDLYEGEKYVFVCLSNEDNKDVKFYHKARHISTKSYYLNKEFDSNFFKNYKTEKLDTLVDRLGLPQPNLIKINVCGAEKDVIEGGVNTIKKAKHLLVALQNEKYFDAPLAKEVGPYIESLGFELKKILDCFQTGMYVYHFENKNI